MKRLLNAGNMNSNRKDEKYVEIQKSDILGNKTVKILFSSPNVLQPYGLFSKYSVLNATPIFLWCIEVLYGRCLLKTGPFQYICMC